MSVWYMLVIVIDLWCVILCRARLPRNPITPSLERPFTAPGGSPANNVRETVAVRALRPQTVPLNHRVFRIILVVAAVSLLTAKLLTVTQLRNQRATREPEIAAEAVIGVRYNLRRRGAPAMSHYGCGTVLNRSPTTRLVRYSD